MADNDNAPLTQANPREFAPPSTISAAAQQALSDGAKQPRPIWPDVDDILAWRKAIMVSDAMWAEATQSMLASARASIETITIAGVRCHDCMPTGDNEAADTVYLYIHGGAFVFGGGAFAKASGARSASHFGLRTVSVDYRMPPDHPFPAAPEDCLAVYRALLETYEPSRIVIGGSSAGGNIAAATTLMIRDQSLPLPAGVILLTPEVDLTESGDSFSTNAEIDIVLRRGLPECNALYAAGHDLRDPYISPLFADFTPGFPPTLVQAGTRDLFLSNAVLIHRKMRDSGIDAELHVWEAMPHGGFSRDSTPEDEEVYAELKRFITRVTSR